MTAQIDAAEPGDDQAVDDPGGNRWHVLGAAELAVHEQLAAAGVPVLRRLQMQRAGRPAIGTRSAEIAVTAGRSVADRLELLDTAEQAAHRAGKSVGAVVRPVSGRMIVTMSLEGFASLARAAAPVDLRDVPVIESWPNGVAPCTVCGVEVQLGSPLRPGRLPPVCSEKCRTQRRKAQA